ncbi:hypothetical protein [Flavihumibacter sp. ZG627]|uniref:hypothetical protein n=1 Tax=Flavihumibacter sp. ZG627 TaxID=1463156 RepID=UPI00057FD657|nr:hypothetical protein [Flavihumibacter sp. ZG627]KIC92113.1 hypothetical protein HY58_00675 [Flavihumibacter sp. ZG627]
MINETNYPDRCSAGVNGSHCCCQYLGEQSLKPRSGTTIMVQPGLASSWMGQLYKEEEGCENTL